MICEGKWFVGGVHPDVSNFFICLQSTFQPVPRRRDPLIFHKQRVQVWSQSDPEMKDSIGIRLKPVEPANRTGISNLYFEDPVIGSFWFGIFFLGSQKAIAKSKPHFIIWDHKMNGFSTEPGFLPGVLIHWRKGLHIHAFVK